MPKRSEQHMAERRQQILDAALRCFSERGFHRTSIADICKAAGLSVGAVYTHFKNKRAITLALGAQSNEWAATLKFETLQDLREFLLNTLRELDRADRAAGVRVDFQLFQLSLHDKKLEQRVRAALPALEQTVLRSLRAFQKRGEIAADYDIENGARLLWAVMHAVWLSKAVDPQKRAAPYQSCINIEFERMTPEPTAPHAPRLARSKAGKRKTSAA